MKLNFKTIIALVIALLALAFPSFRTLILDSEEEISTEETQVVLQNDSTLH